MKISLLMSSPPAHHYGGADINNEIFIPLATARTLNGDISRRRRPGGKCRR